MTNCQCLIFWGWGFPVIAVLLENNLGKISLWTSQQLTCQCPAVTAISAWTRAFNNQYAKILPVGSEGSPDSQEPDSLGQANIRLLLICQLQLWGSSFSHMYCITAKPICLILVVHSLSETLASFVNEDFYREYIWERERYELHNEIKGQSVFVTQFNE